ncbi:hypothetical protein Sjap_015817 [Stephania japonica]|uniref:Uncharacterized protein n=1 Tax=Stephania japonica TaxID=461633 RepID=A0AAP0IKB6_9MAGN
MATKQGELSPCCFVRVREKEKRRREEDQLKKYIYIYRAAALFECRGEEEEGVNRADSV